MSPANSDASVLLIVSNGSPDDLYPANHLLAEGFYLMRARTQLREITNILLK